MLQEFISFCRAEGSSFQLAILAIQDTQSYLKSNEQSMKVFRASLLIANSSENELHLLIFTPSRPDLRPQLQSDSLSALYKKEKKPPSNLTTLPIVPKKDIWWFDGQATVQSSLKSIQLVKKQRADSILLTHFLKVMRRLTDLILKYSAFERCQVITTCHRHWNSILSVSHQLEQTRSLNKTFISIF